MFQSIIYFQMLNTVLFKELVIIIGIFQLLLATENLDDNLFYYKLISPMEKLIKNCQILYVYKYIKKDWLDILNVFELFDFLFLQKIKFTFQRKNNISLVQLSHSVVSNSLRPPWTAACQASLANTNSRSLPKLMSIKSVMPSNPLIFFFPLLLLPSIFLSIRVFSNESALHIRWPKYWSFSFNISPSNEYSGLISFRMDWFDLLAVQGTLKSLLQHHISKASILWPTLSHF